MIMVVHTDFTSKKHTLCFDDDQRIELTKQQSREFEKWFEKKRQERAGK